MSIRHALRSDIPSVTRIFLEQMTQAPYNYSFNLLESEKIITQYFETQVMFVADDEQEITGFIVGDKYLWIGGWHLWIAELFVGTQYQQQGIGSRLLTEIEKHFVNDHIISVELTAHADADSLKFYSNKSFVQTQYIKLEKRL